MIHVVEEASIEDDLDLREELLTFVVAGGQATASLSLTSGAHTFAVRVVDVAGNEITASTDFAVATTGPTELELSLPAGSDPNAVRVASASR